jgi:hypothetical protein
MPLVDTARVDTDWPSSGNPRPDTTKANLFFKDIATYHATQVATRSKTASFDFGLLDWAPICFVDSNSASAITGTVRPNSIVAFPIGAVINLCRVGTGAFVIAPGTSVVINREGGGALSLRAQWSTAFLRKIKTNEWVLTGSLT